MDNMSGILVSEALYIDNEVLLSGCKENCNDY